MSAHSPSDAAVAATLLAKRFDKALEQLLEQCDRDDIPALETKIRVSFAHRCRALNDQHAPLLKLPTELLVEIGKLTLSSTSGRHHKKWFQSVLPLFQTCAHLRNSLDSLRSLKLEHFVIFGKGREDNVNAPTLWDETLENVANWHRKGSHRGTVVVYIQPSHLCTKSPSALAAIAGALECKLYGRLFQPPAINFRAPSGNAEITAFNFECNHHYYINHKRAAGIEEVYEHADGTERSSELLSIEEGNKFWDKAEKAAELHRRILSHLGYL